jgi:hypothetical protein
MTEQSTAEIVLDAEDMIQGTFARAVEEIRKGIGEKGGRHGR